ncbi:MAG: translation initiation factor IF-2, partial [Candidatus Gracilibacteria bacterium]|nr:translation initiation factor IF-2 [Candidatus Gracilibacteria bacterium]
LLDMILLIAEMLELKANPARHGVATIVESHLDSSLGPVATMLVNTGTVRKGDIVFCSGAYGRIKTLKDYRGKNINEVKPSEPAFISGLSTVVEGGDIMFVTNDIELAKNKAREYELMIGAKNIHSFESASLANLLGRIKSGSLKHLKLIVKADSNGSLEALKASLIKLSTNETKVNIIHAGVGEINDSDVLMAGTSQAILVGYNVGILPQAKQTLSNSKIEFIDKKVIYHILEKIESIITGMIDIRYTDEDLGEAKVLKIFYSGKDQLIIGLSIKSGVIQNKAKIRIIRDGKKVGNGEIINLKSGAIDVNEIEAGEECGINYKGDLMKIEEGDIFEAYKVVQRK